MTRNGLLQNLEQLREADERPRRLRAGTLVLASLGGACVIFGIVAQANRRAPQKTRSRDALGELVAQSKGAGAVLSELGGQDVTFPSRLSDDPRTTTALAAVRANGSAGPSASARATGPRSAAAGEDCVGNGAVPPPAADRLSVVPLPAKNLVGGSPILDRSRDLLAQLAKQAGAVSVQPAPQGRPGGYQLQASSFRSGQEAASFAMALRQRGHHAYTEAAEVTGRGTWYRVRIGPFKSKREATLYRSEFEARERLVPLVVDPPAERVP
jgi:cell division septation protein DedD